jgi:hypothetical protein
MAGGIAFEVADSLAVVERHVEEAPTDGLITILFDDDQERGTEGLALKTSQNLTLPVSREARSLRWIGRDR